MKKSNLMFFKSKTKITILTVHCTGHIHYNLQNHSTLHPEEWLVIFQNHSIAYLTAQCKALTLTVWDPVVSNLPEGVGVWVTTHKIFRLTLRMSPHGTRKVFNACGGIHILREHRALHVAIYGHMEGLVQDGKLQPHGGPCTGGVIVNT